MAWHALHKPETFLLARKKIIKGENNTYRHMIWFHDKQWWIVRLLCIFKFLHLTTTIYDVLHDIHVILISANDINIRFFLYEKYFLYENKKKPLTKLIRDFFLRYRGHLLRRFRTLARVLTTMRVVPEVAVHPDPSASKRQPVWIHRTPVSLYVIYKWKLQRIILWKYNFVSHYLKCIIF